MADADIREPDLEQRLRRAAADLRARLRAHQSCRVEEILSSDVALARSDDAILELVYTEWTMREELGERPPRDEMYRRFPTLVQRLERLFEIHDGVHGDEAEHDSGRMTWVSGRRPRAPGPVDSERYEILEELGRGGMGIVFRARQLGLDRDVALKRILAGEYADEQLHARFRAEAETVARLQHPNIVQIHEIGEEDGLPYLAMEYVPGVSLAARLREGPLPPRGAAELVETLARTIQHAHERGVVHRDLKPSNVLLTKDGTPKITDFGLAGQLDRAQRLTGSHSLLGTPSYMAPEQAAGNNSAAPALDVYALGAVLYEAVSGRPPFLAATAADTLLEVRYREPTPLRQLQRHYPRDLETICLKCLRKEPARRYPTALALAEDLRRFLDGRPIQARPTSAAERLVKWVRRHPVVAALSSLLVVGAVVSLAVFTLLWLRTENALTDRETTLRDLRDEKTKGDDKHYRLQLSAARQAWTADNLEEARRLLDECDPKMRDDEWHALHRICHALWHVWPTPNDAVSAIAVAPDNRTVVAVGHKSGYLWDLTAPDAAPRTFKVPEPCYGLACTSNGEFVLVDYPAVDQIDLLYGSLTDGKEVRKRSFPKLDGIDNLRLSPDARRLALARFRKGAEIEVIDLGGGPSRRLALKVAGPPLLFAFSANARWLAAVTDDGLVSHDLDAGKEPFTWNRRKPLSNLAVAPSGAAAIIRHPVPPGPTEILLVDLPTATLRHTLVQDGVQNVTLSLDGRTLAAGRVEKPVELWDVATGKPDMVLRGNPTGAASGAFSPGGQWLLTTSTDNVVRVWRVGRD